MISANPSPLFVELDLEPSASSPVTINPCICRMVGEACPRPAQCHSKLGLPTCWALRKHSDCTESLSFQSSPLECHVTDTPARWTVYIPSLSLTDSPALYPASGRNYVARTGWPGTHTLTAPGRNVIQLSLGRPGFPQSTARGRTPAQAALLHLRNPSEGAGQETREEGRPASKVSSLAVHGHGQQRLCLEATSCAYTECGPPL